MSVWLKKAKIDKSVLDVAEPITDAVSGLTINGSTKLLHSEKIEYYPYIPGMTFQNLLELLSFDEAVQVRSYFSSIIERLLGNPLSLADLKSLNLTQAELAFAETYFINKKSSGFPEMFNFSNYEDKPYVLLAGGRMTWLPSNLIVDQSGAIHIIDID
jgi:hypothetical protein